MERWSEIRREVLTGALSKRAAIAMYGVAWLTLKKMQAHDDHGFQASPEDLPVIDIHSL